MKKSLLALFMAFFLITGCGGSGDDGVDRLSKTDYMTQMSEKGQEMTEVANSMSTVKSASDLDKYIDDTNKIIDDMIALNGPKDHEDKEKAIDDSLTKFKDLLESAKGVGEDTTKLTKFYTDYAEILPELSTALTEYEK